LLGTGAKFWINGQNDEKAGKFVAKMGYGGDFPNYEPIMQERIHLFAPVALIGKDGHQKELAQSGENYRYEGKQLSKGTYILLARQNRVIR